jgi:GGDEF domain-containing protein
VFYYYLVINPGEPIIRFGRIVSPDERIGAMQEELTQREAMRSESDYLAHHDELTGALNRRGLNRVIDTAIQRRQHFGVVYGDITNFKLLNERYGHGYGDRFLQHTADNITSTLRSGDATAFIAKPGGDEFISKVSLDSQRPAMGAHLADVARMERIKGRLGGGFVVMVANERRHAESIGLDPTPLNMVSMSWGGAVWQPGMSRDDLIATADADQQQAKRLQHQDLGQFRPT